MVAGSADTTKRFPDADVGVEIGLTLSRSGPRGLLSGHLAAQVVGDAEAPLHPAPSPFLQPLRVLARRRRLPIPAGERRNVLRSHVASISYERRTRDRRALPASCRG